MIQTNELRIGNWVLLNNTFKRVLWFKYNKVCVMNEYPSAIVDIDRLNSILLTEEILFKCGFVFSHIIGDERVFSNKKINLSINAYDNNIIKFNIFIIKYLHQLQNLYFALTQKELKINL